MLEHVEHRAQDVALVATLERPHLEHRIGVDAIDDAGRLARSLFETIQDLGPRLRPRRELGRTVPRVRPTADTSDDPLADVALQVQAQVADRVALLAVSPPQLLFVEPLHAAPDPRQTLLDDVEAKSAGDPRGQADCGRFHGTRASKQRSVRRERARTGGVARHTRREDTAALPAGKHDAPPPTTTAWLGELRARCGLPSTVLAVLVTVHVAFGVVRLVSGGIVKRVRAVAEYEEAGPIWHFRHSEPDAQRLAAWLLDEMPRDHALLYEGVMQGNLQLLAPLLFPAILVRSSAVAPDGTAAGRPVFRGQPPWLDQGTAGIPVIVGGISSLGWVRR